MVLSETNQSRMRTWSSIRWVVTVFVIAVTLFTLFYQIGSYPVPWYDEGSHLHVAKNYALYGVYADSSSEGYRPFGPAIGVGPTVMLPIAALFQLVGVGIVPARLLIAAYSLLTLFIVYLIAIRMVSWPYALMAVMLLLLTSSIRYQYYSRTVVGEVPGMFFFLLGLALWLHPRGRSVPALVCVGILIGLATITKNQYAFFILPGLLLCWIADLVWYKQRGWRYFVIPGVISGLAFGAWLFIVIIKLGQGNNFTENLTTLRTAGMGAFIVVDAQSIPRVVSLLTQTSLYGSLFIPAFLYAVLTSLRRDEQGQQRGILALFLVISTGLFTISLGWDRYAFGPVILSVFFVVLLINDLVNLVKADKFNLRQVIKTGKFPLSLAVTLVLVGWTFLALFVPLYGRIRDVTQLTHIYANDVADWIKTNVPKSSIIETWEQELGVLTDHKIHYPPQLILAYTVAEEWQNGEPASELYDFHNYVDPEYVIVGPFALYTRIYSEDRLKDYEVIQTFGPYIIYHKRS